MMVTEHMSAENGRDSHLHVPLMIPCGDGDACRSWAESVAPGDNEAAHGMTDADCENDPVHSDGACDDRWIGRMDDGGGPSLLR